MTVTPLRISPTGPYAVPPDAVTSAEITHAADITYRQLDVWTTSGHLHALPRRPGPGHPRCYSRTELTVAVLMARLVDAGLQPTAAHDHARDLLTTGTTRIAGIPLHLPEEL